MGCVVEDVCKRRTKPLGLAQAICVAQKQILWTVYCFTW